MTPILYSLIWSTAEGKEGSIEFSLIIVINLGTALHGRNVGQYRLIIGNVTKFYLLSGEQSSSFPQ